MKNNTYQIYVCPYCNQEYKRQSFIQPFHSKKDLSPTEEVITCDNCSREFTIKLHKVAYVEINFIESIIID